MNKNILFTILFFVPGCLFVSAQVTRTDTIVSKKAGTKTEMRYDIGKGKTLVYYTPKKYAFITDLPKDAAGIVTTTFNKKSVKPLLEIKLYF